MIKKEIKTKSKYWGICFGQLLDINTIRHSFFFQLFKTNKSLYSGFYIFILNTYRCALFNVILFVIMPRA